MRPSFWQLLVLVVILLLLFGAPKLPQMARNLGQSMRIFRSEVKQMKEDDAEDTESTTEDDTKAVEGQVIDEGGSTQTQNSKSEKKQS